MTKTDLVGAQELAAVEARLSGARIAHSAHASLALRDALALLAEPAPSAERAIAPPSPPFSRPRSHDAITRFIAIEATSDIDALHARVSELKARYGDSLLRLKGIVRLKDCVAVVQFARGDAHAQITAAPTDMSDVKSGLTLIVKPGAAR